MDHQKMPAYRVSKTRETSRSKKREQYTRVACESCKIRKVKCSGNMPCSRCVELRGECKYQLIEHIVARREQEPRRILDVPFQNLTQLVSTMKKICDDIESSTSHLSSVPSRGPSLKRRQTDHHNGAIGNKLTHPTNLFYPFDLARAYLEERKATSSTSSDQDYQTQPVPVETSPSANVSTVPAARVVLDLGYDVVLQHVATFTQEVYHMYPCIHLEFARHKMDALFNQLSPSSTGEPNQLDMDLVDIEITKAVLAVSMLIQSEGQHELCSNLEDYLIWNVDVNMKQDTVQIEDIIMSTLMTIYFILRDEAVRAWRMSGFAAKACLELGLHKERVVDICGGAPPNVAFLKDIFSCVYDLDKRCSFYTNLPWTLHDKDIDETVFDLNGRHPFLSTMVRLNRIHGEIVEVVNSSPALGIKETDERAEFLGYRLEKLAESINESPIFPHASPEPLPPPALQTVMCAFVTLRTIHIRMLTHITSLSSPETFSCRSQSAHILISLAISSVNLHVKIIAAAGDRGINRLLQSTLYRLLTVSVSCMFLAASYAPQVYGPICCKAFHTAIDILGQVPLPITGHGLDNICSSLGDLRKIGESIQMPALDKSLPSVSPLGIDRCSAPMQILQMDPDFNQDDVFMPQEITDHEFLDPIDEIYSTWDFQVEPLGFVQKYM